MQLIDFLKTADKDEYIYLGAASGYLWISKPDEMIKKLPELDADYTDRLKVSLERKYALIPYMKRKATTEKEKQELKRMESIKAAQEREYENRIPFAARQVKDMYRRKLVQPFGMCVIIEGTEYGDFWTLEEMEERNGHL